VIGRNRIFDHEDTKDTKKDTKGDVWTSREAPNLNFVCFALWPSCLRGRIFFACGAIVVG